MIGEVIRNQCEYNTWAMERILAACEPLTTEQLHAPGYAGNGSIRDTLGHLLETQQSWFLWFGGTMNASDAIRQRIQYDQMPDVAAVREQWQAVDTLTWAAIDGLSGDDFLRPMPLSPSGDGPTTPLWKLMLHVANHGTQHRSEVAAMLSEHGCSPGHMDMLVFLMPPPERG